ncbi:MAG: hypothetical protein B7C24_13090 [Bacteroidetes bacterium 4572_77]|nr:MAG: hypothetical protein B7C24_13090 [Bacteroidetes bacterium 4572_77]
MNHEKRISAAESSLKSAHLRLDEHAKSNELLMEITGTLKTLIEQNKNQNQKIDKIEVDVSELKGKPGQYWEKVVSTAIVVVVSGVIGAGLTLILK